MIDHELGFVALL